MLLAGRFRKLNYQTNAVPLILALYGHAAKTKRIGAKIEGRVRDDQGRKIIQPTVL